MQLKNLTNPILWNTFEGCNLPSGEKISDIKSIIDHNALGVMLSCVSPENYEKNLKELKELNVPFGFKWVYHYKI